MNENVKNKKSKNILVLIFSIFIYFSISASGTYKYGFGGIYHTYSSSKSYHPSFSGPSDSYSYAKANRPEYPPLSKEDIESIVRVDSIIRTRRDNNPPTSERPMIDKCLSEYEDYFIRELEPYKRRDTYYGGFIYTLTPQETLVFSQNNTNTTMNVKAPAKEHTQSQECDHNTYNQYSSDCTDSNTFIIVLLVVLIMMLGYIFIDLKR